VISATTALRGPALASALVAGACAPRLMKLPSGPGAPAGDAREAVAQATAACRGVSSITAEVAASGSVGGQRLRGRIVAGLAAPASARLEAVAPFGPPLFIIVAQNDMATLLLPRDNRVLERAPSGEVIAAIAGVPLDARDLRVALTACAASPAAERAQQIGGDWRIVPDGAADLYLHRETATAPWQIVAAVHHGGSSRASDTGEWRAEYRDFSNGLPRTIRFRSADGRRFDLRLALSQVETNVALGPEVFRVDIPRDAEPMTLDELKASGPLAAPTKSNGPPR